MSLLGCLGLSKKKAKLGAKLGKDSFKKQTKEDEHAIIGYNFLDSNCRGYYKNQLSMIDVKSTRVRKVSGLKAALRGDRIMMGNTCNGLILLIPDHSGNANARYCVIFNPKSNKLVKRITPPVWFSCSPVGFFYHPLAKEYRTLNVAHVGNNRYEYHIYQFGSNTWRAALNPFSLFRFVSLGHDRPTCTKQALYWYCKDVKKEDAIMVFDIISEEFCVKPFPVCSKENEMHTPTLVAKNNEDSLCCCYVHREELSIDVWVLEDYTNWSWSRKYVVNLNWFKTDKYPSEAWRVFAAGLMGRVKVVSIHKDELVFCYKCDATRSIYSCHLESGFLFRTILSKTDWKKFCVVDGPKQEWYKLSFDDMIGLWYSSSYGIIGL